MIRVVLSSPGQVEAEGLLRPVSGELEPVTSEGSRLGSEAGEDVLERLRRVGSLPVGGAVITPGGALTARYFIHVVIQSQDEPVTVSGVGRALVNGLRRAEEWGLERLALPPLGTGAGSLEAEASAGIMVETIREHLVRAHYPREVIVAVASDYEQDAFRREVERAGFGTATNGS